MHYNRLATIYSISCLNFNLKNVGEDQFLAGDISISVGGGPGGLAVYWFGRWTCNQQVANLRVRLPAVHALLGQYEYLDACGRVNHLGM